MGDAGNGKGETGKVVPARYQPPLPLDKLLLPVGASGAGDRMELDVVIVGAGPAGLPRALELAHPAPRARPGLNIGAPQQATAPTGLDRDGQPLATHQSPNDIVAQVTVLAEGTRGMLAQAYLEWQRVAAENPQIFALGVKEIWETKQPLDSIVHTLGWPLPRDAFGGSFMYPLEPRLVALGLVVGLDYRAATLDVHALLQRMKLHPRSEEHTSELQSQSNLVC